MVYPESQNRDASFIQDAITDRPTLLQSEHDARSASKVCLDGSETVGRLSQSVAEKPSTEICAREITTDGQRTNELIRGQDSEREQYAEESTQEHNICRIAFSKCSLSEERVHMDLGQQALDCFWSAEREPPVTKESLSELDLDRILNDSRLRHDMNFDRNVSFVPITNGRVGSERHRRANEYWNAVRIECTLYIKCQGQPLWKHPGTSDILGSLGLPQDLPRNELPLRLPKLFQSVREIVKTLVPETEWCSVDERLDVDLLAQELEKGVCDIVTLSDWLASLLLRSCAPMRDSLIKKLVPLVRSGFQHCEAGYLVEGLICVFDILETMKLVSSLLSN